MPIELGMASSHAPALFAETADGWDRLWKRFTKTTPQPPEAAAEGPAAIADFVARTKAGFAAINAQLAAYKPDALIVLAGDQAEWFGDANVPNIMMYVGKDDIVGVHNHGADDHDPPIVPEEHPDRFGVRLRVDADLGEHLLKRLVNDGFDIAASRVQRPLGARNTSPHALMRPLPLIMPSADLPIVPIILKTVERSTAVLTGKRCLELGRALARICKPLGQRLAIYGSGGLSHDPIGPRAGWVDEPLDRWVLDQMVAGTPDKLETIFSFASQALQGGTGEIRCWIPVAAAMDTMQPGRGAVLVDYFAARKSTSGCAWMYWPDARAQATVAA